MSVIRRYDFDIINLTKCDNIRLSEKSIIFGLMHTKTNNDNEKMSQNIIVVDFYNCREAENEFENILLALQEYYALR